MSVAIFEYKQPTIENDETGRTPKQELRKLSVELEEYIQSNVTTQQTVLSPEMQDTLTKLTLIEAAIDLHTKQGLPTTDASLLNDITTAKSCFIPTYASVEQAYDLANRVSRPDSFAGGEFDTTFLDIFHLWPSTVEEWIKSLHRQETQR